MPFGEYSVGVINDIFKHTRFIRSITPNYKESFCSYFPDQNTHSRFLFGIFLVRNSNHVNLSTIPQRFIPKIWELVSLSDQLMQILFPQYDLRLGSWGGFVSTRMTLSHKIVLLYCVGVVKFRRLSVKCNLQQPQKYYLDGIWRSCMQSQERLLLSGGTFFVYDIVHSSP